MPPHLGMVLMPPVEDIIIYLGMRSPLCSYLGKHLRRRRPQPSRHRQHRRSHSRQPLTTPRRRRKRRRRRRRRKRRRRRRRRAQFWQLPPKLH